MYDAIIIGAGMSGLAAGIRLAHYDQRVCILERHTTIGGLNSFYRQAGRNFDVGLHALTNFTPKGAKKGPLARLLKQLRFRWEDFDFSPQIRSAVRFPGVSLDFSNDPALLESEVAAKFPHSVDAWRQLRSRLLDYDDLDGEVMTASARQVVGEILKEPLLLEMVFCPLMYYGNAREHDMDFGQFCIMFRSIFQEGLARPISGVRLILKHLVRRYRELGGELKLRSGVKRICVDNEQAVGVELDSGELLQTRCILSSAGLVETMRLCDDVSEVDESRGGRLSFTETMSVLDCQPAQLGHPYTIVFYNDAPSFDWRKPAEMVDLRSGVICSPNNFVYDEPLAEGMIRVTNLANFDAWKALPEPEYRLQKLKWFDAIAASCTQFMPDFRGHIVATDMFTPTTVRRYTGHVNGAVYGAPEKKYDGCTHLKNVFLCGTDQGYVGVIGAIVSGIMMANKHVLRGGGG